MYACGLDATENGIHTQTQSHTHTHYTFITLWIVSPRWIYFCFFKWSSLFQVTFTALKWIHVKLIVTVNSLDCYLLCFTIYFFLCINIFLTDSTCWLFLFACFNCMWQVCLLFGVVRTCTFKAIICIVRFKANILFSICSCPSFLYFFLPSFGLTVFIWFLLLVYHLVCCCHFWLLL